MHDQKNVLTLFLLSSEDIKAHLPVILSYLTEEERARASRYAREADRLMSAGGAYLIRRKLGRDTIILRTDEGKPYVEDHVRFNLSHSCGLVAAVFGGKNEIGVDVEKIREGFDDLRTRVLTQPELDSGLDFFALFTAKESLSKAVGTGLLPSPKDFPALPPDGKILFRGKPYYRHALTFGGYRISVCQEHADFILQKEFCHEPTERDPSVESL